MEPIRGLEAKPLPPEHYHAIGLVAANWAALEILVASAIWRIGEIPDDIGACLTSQIYTFDSKVKALEAILKRRGDLEPVIKALSKFNTEAGNALRRRNRAMHDGWIVDAETDEVMRYEITANRKLRLGYVGASTSDLMTLAQEILDLTESFEEAIRPALERFPRLPLE